jgi:putative transposase
MNADYKKMEIATFRFGLISEFVTGVKLSWGEKDKLLREKCMRRYAVPGSDRNKVSRASILSWVKQYEEGGRRIEALFPKERIDKGQCRALTPELRLAIKELRRDSPKLRLPAIINELKHRKFIAPDEEIKLSTIYRYLQNENLTSLNEDAIDKRHFEASQPNEIWQSDIMHGPRVMADGKEKKSYLIAVLDDHSRLITHAQFYLTEGIEHFRDCLRQSIMVRGLPQKLYIDNGSCYRAKQLEHITASLGIAITHSRPYTPQGRGKIERWFRYIRDNFLPQHEGKKETLDNLNKALFDWVFDYNNKLHGTTKQTPYERYKQNLQCVRPAPPDLTSYFRHVEIRQVKRDRTIRLKGHVFEAPVKLIDRKVEVKYLPGDYEKIEVFFNGISYGFANPVDPHVNSKIGRNWEPLPPKKGSQETITVEEPKITGGELFGSNSINWEGEE